MSFGRDLKTLVPSLGNGRSDFTSPVELAIIKYEVLFLSVSPKIAKFSNPNIVNVKVYECMWLEHIAILILSSRVTP